MANASITTFPDVFQYDQTAQVSMDVDIANGRIFVLKTLVDELDVVDARTTLPVIEATVSAGYTRVTSDQFGTVLLVNETTGVVTLLDGSDLSIRAEFGVPSGTLVAADGQSGVIYTATREGVLTVRNEADLSVRGVLDLGGPVTALLADHSTARSFAVVDDGSGPRLVAVDPVSMTVVARASEPVPGLTAAAASVFGPGSLWVTSRGPDAADGTSTWRLTSIDRNTLAPVASTPLPFPPLSLAVDYQARPWVLGPSDEGPGATSWIVLDPSTLTVAATGGSGDYSFGTTVVTDPQTRGAFVWLDYGRDLSLQVLPSEMPGPQIAVPAGPCELEAAVGAEFTYQVKVIGTFDQPASLFGVLPDGIGFDGDRTVSGIPTTTGVSTFNLAWGNDRGGTGSSCTLTVLPEGSTPAPIRRLEPISTSVVSRYVPPTAPSTEPTPTETSPMETGESTSAADLNPSTTAPVTQPPAPTLAATGAAASGDTARIAVAAAALILAGTALVAATRRRRQRT